jgi:hypothetical protein
MDFTYQILVATIRKILVTDFAQINAVGLAHTELLNDLHYLATAA